MKRIAAEHRELMHRATEELSSSGAVLRALGEGSEAPPFTLADSSGEKVGLRGLLDRGPVVLTFFRGHW